MEDHPLLLAGLATACAVFVYNRASKSQNPTPLPPGPKGLPLVGNVLDLPQTQAWLTFAKWAEEYGPITHVRVPGLSIIVLNDATYTSDLLDKKGRQYSDRPRLVMGGELVGWDQGPALAQFGKPWSDYRRIMAQFLGSRPKISGSYGQVLEEATHQYLKDLLSSPTEWVEHGCRFAAAIVLQIAFGYKAESKDDPLISIVDEAVAQFSETTAPNAYAVDTFPFLRYVPEWFPGAGWKKKATHYRETLDAMLNLPFEMVKTRMAEGTSPSCVVSDLLSGDKKLTIEEEKNIKWAAAGIYSGGAETTAASMEAFILAITLHPDAQRKAQQELDTVLGRGVVPTLSDRSRLPYNEALISEAFRLYTIGPLGLPHVSTEDDVYNGYFIPKGSMIIANNWLFNRDSSTYANPEVFRPERFIASESHDKERDPRETLFGYGRRTCPGIHLADASTWLVFTSTLAFFDIKPPVAEDGKPAWPSGKFMDGSISHPEPFECAITPREGVVEVIRRLG